MPVHTIEVIPDTASGLRRPGATTEGSLALADVLMEADLIDLRGGVVMDHQKPVPVYCWISTM